MVISRRRATLLLVAVFAACSSSGGDQVRAQARDHSPPAGSATPGSGAPVSAAPRVYLATASGEVGVDVEVVDTEPLIQRGLMYRTFLPANAGMLFVPRVEQVWRFWMRNTLIPLDMIFIARDLTIAGIVENAVPHDETSRYVDRPSLYILEVNGGWAKAHGVTAGAKVRFEHVAAVGK